MTYADAASIVLERTVTTLRSSRLADGGEAWNGAARAVLLRWE